MKYIVTLSKGGKASIFEITETGERVPMKLHKEVLDKLDSTEPLTIDNFVSLYFNAKK